MTSRLLSGIDAARRIQTLWVFVPGWLKVSILTAVSTSLGVVQQLPWQAIFVYSLGTLAFGMIFLHIANELIEQNARAKLQLTFDPTRPPFVHDKVGVNNQTLRIFRVGVVNTGETADVKVKLVDMTPLEVGASYVAHELWPMGQPANTMTATVHPTRTPMVFFDVVGQLFPPGGPANTLHVRYAAEGLYGRSLSGSGPYRLTVGIDGPSAEDPQSFLVEMNGSGIWEMRQV